MKTEELGAGFTIRVADDYEEMSRLAAEEIVAEVGAKPDLLLCAATGSTPTRMYELLAAGEISEFKSMRVVKLDEWGQLPMDADGSCEAYLQKHLIGPLKISPDRYLSFDSMGEPDADCLRVTKALAESGPIDLCILGLGLNGHLGFNESADALQPLPHRAELAPSSLQHPMIQKAKVPITYGLTLGMAHLMQSKKILFLVNGAHKKAAMQQLLSGKITTQFPASFLWQHPNVTCLCDSAAL